MAHLHKGRILTNTRNCFHAKMNSLKNRLMRLSEIVGRDCPGLIEMVPSPDNIDISKLGNHAGIIMTDSCNATQKARCLLQHKIGGNVHVRLILAKCTYEVSAGEKKKTGQTALSREVILCYDETKKNAQPFC